MPPFMRPAIIRFLFSVAVCVSAGCCFTPNDSDNYVTSASTPKRNIPSVAPIVITDVAELPKHVGKVVTLKGLQSRTKLPNVLGVRVDGAYALSDKMVYVTGRLSSYVTTEADVMAFDDLIAKKGPFTAARPMIGTHFVMQAPETGEFLTTHSWANREK